METPRSNPTKQWFRKIDTPQKEISLVLTPIDETTIIPQPSDTSVKSVRDNLKPLGK